MDYSMNKEELAVVQTIFDACQEQPIDLNFSLPDYCPDIQRILKCQVYPQIDSRVITGDRLDIDGTFCVKILYLDAEKMCVHCFEHNDSFACSFHLGQSVSDAVVLTKTKTEYLNCRALSPRKLDIRGAFSVCAKVLTKAEQELVCSIEGEGVQQRTQQLGANMVAALAQDQFTISEVLEVGQGKPEVNTIVRVDIVPLVHDCKSISGKLILKGEAIVKILYLGGTENSTLETMEYEVPISQIIDAPGLEDDCICNPDLSVLNYQLEPQEDNAGDLTLMTLEMRLSASVIAYTEKEVHLVCDAYSTQYDLDIIYQPITLTQLMPSVQETYIEKSMLDLGEGSISSIQDLWNEVSSVTAKVEEGKLHFTGKFNVCILAFDGQDTPIYMERLIDFTHVCDWAGDSDNLQLDAQLKISSMTYRITGGDAVEIRAELALCVDIQRQIACKTIVALEADESRPKIKDPRSALVLYYASPGEKIWDIARQYETSMDAIMQENELVDDVLNERMMLLIPM